jgi:flagellar protein FlaG
MKIQSTSTGIQAEVAVPVAIPKKDEGSGSAASGSAAVSAVPSSAPVSPTAVAPVQPVEKPKETARIAEEVSRYLKENRSKLDISLDKDLNMIVTKVLQEESGEVIRQYPPETVIEVLKYFRSQRGMLVNEKG